MLGLDSFNVVIVGAFVVQQLDYDEFDFNGQKAVERLRVPPLLQGGVGEFALDVMPNRFQVTATGVKATEYRATAVTGAVKKFVDEYVGRRSVQLVGHNFSGKFQPSGRSSTSFLADFINISRLQRAAGQDRPLVRETLAFTYQATADARATVQLEPLRGDDTRVFYNLNFTFGADVAPNDTAPPLQVPVAEAVDSLMEMYHLGSDLLQNLSASDTQEST